MLYEIVASTIISFIVSSCVKTRGGGFSKITFSKCYPPVNSIQSAVNMSFVILGRKIVPGMSENFHKESLTISLSL